MGHRIAAVARLTLARSRDARHPLNSLDRMVASRETDELRVEIVEPAAQLRRCVPFRIGGNKNQLDLSGYVRRQFLKRGAKIRHVHRTLIGAIRVAEEQQSNCSIGPAPEIERSSGSVGKNESRFGHWRVNQSAAIGAVSVALGARGGRKREE